MYRICNFKLYMVSELYIANKMAKVVDVDLHCNPIQYSGVLTGQPVH